MSRTVEERIAHLRADHPLKVLFLARLEPEIAALDETLKTDAARKGFNAMGFNPGVGTPAQLTQLINNDMRLFTTVIRERNLKFDG